jgi:hypothetical protein
LTFDPWGLPRSQVIEWDRASSQKIEVRVCAQTLSLIIDPLSDLNLRGNDLSHINSLRNSSIQFIRTYVCGRGISGSADMQTYSWLAGWLVSLRSQLHCLNKDFEVSALRAPNRLPLTSWVYRSFTLALPHIPLLPLFESHGGARR